MALQIRFEKEIPIKKRKLRQKIKMVLKDLGCDDKEVSILFTDDEYISRLNKKYLNRNGPTNVISFPMGGKEEENMGIPLLGDIIISVDTARREAEEAGEPIEFTIYRLIIHGLLHLLGYDHEHDEKEAEKMFEMEDRILSKITQEERKWHA